MSIMCWRDEIDMRYGPHSDGLMEVVIEEAFAQVEKYGSHFDGLMEG